MPLSNSMVHPVNKEPRVSGKVFTTHAQHLIVNLGPTKKISVEPISSSASLTGLMSDLSLSPRAVPVSTIYQYERSLSGITGVLYEPRFAVPNMAPSLGDLGDKYVNSHGYNEASIRCIHSAFHLSNDIDEFTDHLSKKGLPKCEARFLWTIINGKL
jgi:hypothetical protein